MSKMSQNCQKKIGVLEFGDDIWNHRQKCIHISTNMPSIGSVICDIDFEFQEF